MFSLRFGFLWGFYWDNGRETNILGYIGVIWGGGSEFRGLGVRVLGVKV